ncbi:MAG TPA: B12-binding domain-containing radical SAM protein [Polyangia bacterium]|nr:B12-binding domain-containing radical SAM protein [Polyangia bacterium]
MRVLLVYPSFPKTYWGAEYAMPLAGRKSILPPLGLITVAALLPQHWELELADLNVRPLDPAALDRADAVFVSGMLVQRESLLEVARLARARGKIVVAGGAYASTSPDALAPYVDCVVVGEAEDLIGELAAALESGTPPRRMQALERPDVSRVPPPRYDLLDMNAYVSIGVQWSRGCPFNCEFCDIIEIFGRKPRTKSPEQLCRELDAIYSAGFRGSVFVVDDNFIGNKVLVRRMLPTLTAWMRAHGDPFDLYTEASVNLAADDTLIDAMVEAGFTSVFLGIETPSPEALRETQKLQNTAVDLDVGVRKLIERGLDVMAGFIIGFDADDAEAVERQREWIARSPIPLAMVGVLIALPGTQLERRLAAEGRLLHESGGDNFGRTNFVTKLDEPTLLEGFARLLADVYRPAAYFDRCARALELCPREKARFRRSLRFSLACFARSLLEQGLLSNYRLVYFRFLLRVLWRAPQRFPRAIGLAIHGAHMIRYTREDVLPRLQASLKSARQQPRRRARSPLLAKIPLPDGRAAPAA